MAAHTLTRASLLAWGASPVVTAAEFWDLDQKTRNAPNFVDGGTWSPTAEIIIGGSFGLNVTGPLLAADVQNIEITGAWLITGNGEFGGSAITFGSGSILDMADEAKIEVNDTCEVNVNTGGLLNIKTGGDLVLQNGGDLVVQSGGEIAVQSGGFINIQSGADLIVLSGGELSIGAGANLSVGAGALFNSLGTISIASGGDLESLTGSTVTLGGTTLQTGTLTKSGSGGRTQWRRTTLGSNLDHTVDVDFDTYVYSNSGGTPRTLTCRVSTSPVPVMGERMRFSIINTGGTVTIQNEGSGNTILELGAVRVRFELEFDGTIWRLSGGVGSNPAHPGTITWGTDS